MNTDIHRLLDEAFAGVEMTADARELKEEVRANLMARTAELEAAGSSPADAAKRAITELGPVGDLLETAPLAAPSDVRTTNQHGAVAAELHARNKVRPNPGFVVRATLLSVGAAAAVTLAVLAAFGAIGGGAAATCGLGLAGAALLGFVTADSLSQETTANYGTPLGRAVAWGIGTFAGVAALAAFGAFVVDTETIAFAIVGGVLSLIALGLLSWLGATQTNRHKEWTREVARGYAHHSHANRFETDPDAAARYGIYSGVVWVLGIGAAIWLSIAFAWWWSLVVLTLCVALSMLFLSTMLYGGSGSKRER